VGTVCDAQVHAEFLEGGIEKLLERGAQAVNFVDEQDVARPPALTWGKKYIRPPSFVRS
jgi:hypothetical protein